MIATPADGLPCRVAERIPAVGLVADITVESASRGQLSARCPVAIAEAVAISAEETHRSRREQGMRSQGVIA
jgi:hypothetical protein